jgi:hypothetical protein
MVRRLIRWLQPAFLLLALAAIGWFLANQWPVLRTFPWQLHAGWMVATLLLTLLSWAVEILLWRHVLVEMGGHFPLWAAVRGWFLSAIVRYVPGTVWQPISLTLFCRRHGIAPEITIASLVLFQVVMMLAIAPIFVVYFLWIDTQSLAAQWVAHVPTALLWVGAALVVAFLLRPQWSIQLTNWLLTRMGRKPLQWHISSGKLLLLTLVGLFCWLLWGGVFAAFTFAVAGNGIATSASEGVEIAGLLIASYPIANFVGFISFITPSGIGVREGAFYLLLTPPLAGSVVTVLALGIRMWGLLNELCFALLSLPFERGYFGASVDESHSASDDAPSDAVADAVVTPELALSRRKTP